VVDKAALELVLSKYFGSPANHHFTNFSIIIVPSGPNWTPPRTMPIKNVLICFYVLFSLFSCNFISSFVCHAINKGIWSELDKILTEILKILHTGVRIKDHDTAVDKFMWEVK
jgi:hypothetical protein